MMPLQQFSNGDRVNWTDGDVRRQGVVTQSDVEGPADAGDKAAMRFYRVTSAEGASHLVPENELEPTDSPIVSRD